MIQPSNYFLNLAGSYIRNILHQENVSDIEAINIANTQNIPYLYYIVFLKHL